MLGVLGVLGSVASFLGGIGPAVSTYLSTAKNVEAQEFAAMTAQEQSEYLAYTKSQSALNSAKVVNNRAFFAHVMVYMFGIPPALHWGATYLTATFPDLGFHTDALHGFYAEAEEKIALSFFLLAPSIPVVGALASRLRG